MNYSAFGEKIKKELIAVAWEAMCESGDRFSEALKRDTIIRISFINQPICIDVYEMESNTDWKSITIEKLVADRLRGDFPASKKEFWGNEDIDKSIQTLESVASQFEQQAKKIMARAKTLKKFKQA